MTVYAILTVSSNNSTEVYRCSVGIFNYKFTVIVDGSLRDSDTVFTIDTVLSIFSICSVCTINTIFAISAVFTIGAYYNTKICRCTVCVCDNKLTVCVDLCGRNANAVFSIHTIGSINAVFTIGTIDAVLTVLTVQAVSSILTVSTYDYAKIYRIAVRICDYKFSVGVDRSLGDSDTVYSVLAVNSIDTILTINAIFTVDSVFAVGAFYCAEIHCSAACKRYFKLTVSVDNDSLDTYAIFSVDTIFTVGSIYTVLTIFTISTVFTVFTVSSDNDTEILCSVVGVSDDKFTAYIDLRLDNADTGDTVFTVLTICSVFAVDTVDTVGSIDTIYAIFSIGTIFSVSTYNIAKVRALSVGVCENKLTFGIDLSTCYSDTIRTICSINSILAVYTACAYDNAEIRCRTI